MPFICKYSKTHYCSATSYQNHYCLVGNESINFCKHIQSKCPAPSKKFATQDYVNERIQIALQTMASKSYVKDRVNNHNHSPEPPAPMSTTPLTDIINKLKHATWKTSKGTYVRICDMATPHIVNALNMMKKDKNKYKHLAFQSMLTILKSRDWNYDSECCPFSNENIVCTVWENSSNSCTNCPHLS